MASPKLIFKAYLDAFCARNLDEAATMITDDFEFRGPVVQANGRADFVSKTKPLLPMVTGYRMIGQLAEGNEVCSFYEFCVQTTKGKGAIPMMEWATLRGDKIARSRVVFNTTEFTALMPT